MLTLGVAYHSPLDLLGLVPGDKKISLSSDEVGDVFFTRVFQESHKSKVQIVFTTPRLLISKDVKIIDQGTGGQILNLNNIDWKKLLD